MALAIFASKALRNKNESSPNAWALNHFPDGRARPTIFPQMLPIMQLNHKMTNNNGLNGHPCFRDIAIDNKGNKVMWMTNKYYEHKGTSHMGPNNTKSWSALLNTSYLEAPINSTYCVRSPQIIPYT